LIGGKQTNVISTFFGELFSVAAAFFGDDLTDAAGLAVCFLPPPLPKKLRMSIFEDFDNSKIDRLILILIHRLKEIQ